MLLCGLIICEADEFTTICGLDRLGEKMQNHADKTRETRSKAVANLPALKHGSETVDLQFVDHRPEAVQLKTLQEMADNSLQAEATGRLKAIVNNNARNVVQRLRRRDRLK